jgi:hypothetical protein
MYELWNSCKGSGDLISYPQRDISADSTVNLACSWQHTPDNCVVDGPIASDSYQY